MRKMTVAAIMLILVLAFASSAFAAVVSDVGGRLAFISDRSGKEAIWVMDVVTGDTKKIISIDQQPGWVYVDMPRWNATGKKIFFMAYAGKWNIFVINDDGTGLARLTSFSSNIYNVNPVASPNNPDVVYYQKVQAAYSSVVHSYNIATGEDVEIPNSSGRTTQYFDISTDELMMLFAREPGCCHTNEMYSGYQDLFGGSETIIKPTDGYAEWVGRINRKDGWIAYHEATGVRAPVNIFKMDPDGKNVTKLTFGTGSDMLYYPVWAGSDNNGYMFFGGSIAGQKSEIYAMKADGTGYPSGLVNVTNNPATERSPDWTPLGGTKLNEEPVAACKNVTVNADDVCQASVSASDIDNGSNDADGTIVSMSLSDSGPFTLGTHNVTLTVTDDKGAAAECSATVTVADNTAPLPALSEPVCTTTGNRKAKKISVGATDNCSVASASVSSVEIINNGGNTVNGGGVADVIGNDIFVYPDGNGWSVKASVTAGDGSGNIMTTTVSEPLPKCK